jgi:hypothetical protein
MLSFETAQLKSQIKKLNQVFSSNCCMGKILFQNFQNQELPLSRMAVRTPITQAEESYFITFTCKNWLLLFEITNSYHKVYKWFDYLKNKGHYIKGYVFDE